MWKEKKTTSRDEGFYIRESTVNPGKNSQEVQQDLAPAAVIIHDSTVRKRFLRGGRKIIIPQKNTIIDCCHDERKIFLCKTICVLDC